MSGLVGLNSEEVLIHVTLLVMQVPKIGSIVPMGGLVGCGDGSISDSLPGAVSGQEDIGGLVGCNSNV